MKIHSDKISEADLYRAAPDGFHVDAVVRGSRKRARAFDVHAAADPGVDAHGIKRAYAGNSGKFGALQDGPYKAATWVEWGDWMVELLKIDPEAIIGPYEGAAGFVEQTTQAATYQQARYDAPTHAARWARELRQADARSA